MIDNRIDIIGSDEIMKKKLIFKNPKSAANANIFEKIADLTNQRERLTTTKSIGFLSHKHEINSRR